MGPGVATPPPPPGIRAQQGALGMPPQMQPQDNPVAMVVAIMEIVRRLSGVLGKTNPSSVTTLRAVMAPLAQLISELQQGPQGQQQPPMPAPTPSEVSAPSESAAPGGGSFMPGM